MTKEAFQDPHKETVGWENFLGMTIGQAVVWASQNIDPKHTNPELTTSEPYVMGSHATCSGAWASGPEDYAPVGIPVGLQPHDDGRGPVRRRRHHRRHRPQVLVGLVHGRPHRRQGGGEIRARPGQRSASGQRGGVRRPEEDRLQAAGTLRSRTATRSSPGTVSPSYLLPIHGLQRLEKIMDEYVGGIGANYTTNEPLLTRGLELLGMLKEDLAYLGAEDLHQLQRAWELQHRVLASEGVTQHTLFRTETRWPGYYYRADHPKLDDEDWHCFTLSRYDRDSGKWAMEKAPVYHIID